jgi:hypothetical protein
MELSGVGLETLEVVILDFYGKEESEGMIMDRKS